MKKYLWVFFVFITCVFYIIFVNYSVYSSEMTGVLLSFIGDVKIFKKGSDGEMMPKIRERFYRGDYLVTGKNAKAKVLVYDGAVILVAPDSRFTFVKRRKNNLQEKDLFRLIFGKIRIMLKKVTGEKKRFEVATPTALCAVRGTDFIVLVNKDKATNVFVIEGSVEVENLSVKDEKNSILLPAGKRASVADGGMISDPVDIKKNELEKLLEGVERELLIKDDVELPSKKIMWTERGSLMSKKNDVRNIDDDIFLYGPSRNMLLPGLIEMLSLKKQKKKDAPAPLPPPHPDF